MTRIATGLVLGVIASGLAACATPQPAVEGDHQAAPQPAMVEDARLLPYVEPAQLVDIGGRRINLRCTGEGGPTVVLLSGLSSWSTIWYKTQPEIAKETRVCAFDRASYGFSDPAPLPQNVTHVVDDLHATLQAADVPGPYVLVGHSLGGVEARVFAERWPDEVVGMVLVDTSPAGEFLIEVELPHYDEVIGGEFFYARMAKCVMLAADGPLDASDPNYSICAIGPLPDDTPAALREAWPSFFTAEYSASRLSLYASLFTHRYDSADRLDFGDKPLVVLSADYPWGLTERELPFWGPYTAQWHAQHQALAQLSSRGLQRVVTQAGHSIQLDQPQAVVDAVDEVLQQLR